MAKLSITTLRYYLALVNIYDNLTKNDLREMFNCVDCLKLASDLRGELAIGALEEVEKVELHHIIHNLNERRLSIAA